MKYAVAALLILSWAAAQEEPAGVLSYIDIDPVPISGFEGCIGESSDTLKRDCLPHVEVVVIEEFERCAQDNEGCDRAGAYPVSFLPEELAKDTETAFEEAWEKYYDETIRVTQEKVNEAPFCWLPNVCPMPIIRWDCVAERLVDSAAVSLTELNPEYWVDINTAIATHIPTALWWKSPLPRGGAVVTPVFSLAPKPEQYQRLVEEPRDVPYYMNADLPIPYLKDEIRDDLPGLIKKELRKYELEPATMIEYQKFGYTTFFEAYGDFQNTMFFRPSKGPYMYTICLSFLPPYVILVPIPTPLFIPMVPRAFTAWPAVAEGYTIPRVKGKPLW